MEGYKKLKKDIRGLLCREKLENGKKSTVREMELRIGIEEVKKFSTFQSVDFN